MTVGELGFMLTHPTVDYDITSQFTAEEIRRAVSLTSAIQSGALVWRKVAAGATESPSSYDSDFSEIEELAESVAPLSLGAASVGTSQSLSRSDHTHAHGDQGGGSLHALVTTLSAGFMSPADKVALGQASVSASPGFTWGKSGTVPAGSYLTNDGVPSNTAGRLVPIATGAVTTIFVTAEINSTATIEVQRRVGAVFTTIASLTLVNERKKTVELPSPPAVALNDEIAIHTSGASIKNPVVGLIIRGSIS